MIGVAQMYRHVQTQHTPNDEMKHRCDVCGKGFYNKSNFEDHQNIHTGRKPYKCKFCLAAFASKGTWAMHERGHVGRGRNFVNKNNR